MKAKKPLFETGVGAPYWHHYCLPLQKVYAADSTREDPGKFDRLLRAYQPGDRWSIASEREERELSPASP